jgi:hypothetical protein
MGITVFLPSLFFTVTFIIIIIIIIIVIITYYTIFTYYIRKIYILLQPTLMEKYYSPYLISFHLLFSKIASLL